MHAWSHLLVVSGCLNQRSFHTLFRILLVYVAGQSHSAGALSSGMIDVAKIVQRSTFQHLICTYVSAGESGGGERERERVEAIWSVLVAYNILLGEL